MKYYQINFETTKFARLSADSVGDKTALYRLSHGLHYLFWQFKYLVLILILSAIITPPDVSSQILVCFPLIILYEFSIKLSAQVIKRKNKKKA